MNFLCVLLQLSAICCFLFYLSSLYYLSVNATSFTTSEKPTTSRSRQMQFLGEPAYNTAACSDAISFFSWCPYILYRQIL